MNFAKFQENTFSYRTALVAASDSCNKNAKFTVNRFINEDVYFLDINIHQNNTDTYHKDMHTGQYIHYCSQTPWKLKTCKKAL